MTEEKRSLKVWLRTLSVYQDRRVVAVLFLGFTSGLPLALTTGTLAIWMARTGVNRTAIGLFAVVGLPYTLKFLWAPLVDQLQLPFLTLWLGRRRGWAVFTQTLLMAGLLALGSSQPANTPWLTAWLAVVVTFCSASQDIVVDAYRIDILADHQQGAGAAVTQAGYRLGMLTSGAGALFLAERVSWSGVYTTMAVLMTVGIVTILLSPEPDRGRQGGGRITSVRSNDDKSAPNPTLKASPILAWLDSAVVTPCCDFLLRPGAGIVLAFILLYKCGDAFAAVMANPFFVDIGFTNSEIAGISKVFGLFATLAGVFIGGLMVNSHGVIASLLGCGILQMLSNLMFAVQAMVGHNLTLLAVTIGVENLAGGMGSAAFVAYLSLLCNVTYSATQYALLSSFMAVGRTVLASGAGWMATYLDWGLFFVVSAAAAAPGLLLLVWKRRLLQGVCSALSRPG